MSQPASDAAPISVEASIPGTWAEIVVVGGVCLIAALAAFVLSHLARRHLRRAPSWALVPLCGTILPLILFAAGYWRFESEVDLLRWLADLPMRAWRNFALLSASGTLSAWFVLRGRRSAQIDVDAFD